MKMLINGIWISKDKTTDITNPYTGKLIDTVPSASIEDALKAVASAQENKHIIGSLSAHKRADILDKAALLIMNRLEDFAQVIVAETGKTIEEGRKETRRCINTLQLSASQARSFNGESIPFDSMTSGKNKIGFYKREPLGVILAITPFNDPLNLVAHKLGPAIASGNSVILKPSGMAPLSALRLCETLIEAGLPIKSLNVITGSGRELNEPLINNEIIRMISFTGGTATGKKIAASAGIVRLSFELGGCGSCIVMSDANINQAVEKCVEGAFSAAGENCISVQKVLVHRSVFNDFRDKFVAATKLITFGDPSCEKTMMGTMISEKAAKQVQTHVNNAITKGAKVLIGNTVNKALYSPTVLTDVSEDDWLSKHEIFGPVVILYPFDDINNAIDFSNAPGGAIHMAIFTSDINQAFSAFNKLEASMVLINESTDFRIDAMPFGGAGTAGLGREGIKFSMEEMTEPKAVCISLD